MSVNNSRFLITNADARVWRDDVPLLFLGEWCVWNSGKEALANLDFEVAAPYGWEDGQRESDYRHVWELIERLLPDLCGMLNRYHSTGYSSRYWRIMLGTWLYKFTIILFNRWATVRHALRGRRVSGAVVLEFPREQLVPSGYISFARLYRLDVWNLAVFGRILRDCSDVPCTVKQVATLDGGKKCDLQTFTQTRLLTVKQRVRRLVRRLVQPFVNHLTRPNDAMLISTGMPFWQECWLQVSMGQVPITWWLEQPPEAPPNFATRDRLSLRAENFAGFEGFVRKLIPEHLPTCYLEGYQALCAKATGMPWPTRPRFIFTANSFDGDEVFKAWAAAKVEQGVPYLIGQHGANYGAGMFAPSEVHETATADRYLTWGWQEDAEKHRPVVALTMIGKTTIKSNSQGGLLLVERGGGQRETLWDEIPAFRRYLEAQFSFISGLKRGIDKQVTIRLYSVYLNLNWSENIIWKKHFPQVRLDDGKRHIGGQIADSRLTVFSYESTGALELLVGNVPILIFYDTQDYPLRPCARPYYERLKAVGIFHESPGSAAEKVNEIWSNVQGWWEREEVQEARRAFCEHFARMPQNPLRELKCALLEN